MDFNPSSKIRNFSIIAHVDHGKSTLSDKLLEYTHTISKRDLKDQFLDNLELERERGITIKLQTIRMEYKGYILNLIDTPGHVDFQGEVARSLRASDGAILLIDASGGIEAQTIGNYLQAIELDIPVIPVLNKVDIKGIDIDKVLAEIKAILGFDREDIIFTSGKTGIGIEKLIDTIIEKIPPPSCDTSKDQDPMDQYPKNFRGFVFDSFFDEYQGVILLVKVVDGILKKGDTIYFCSKKKAMQVLSLGYVRGKLDYQNEVHAGDVCFITTGIKYVKDVVVQDTIVKNITDKPVFEFSKPKSMVFASIYPVDAADIDNFKDAISKLALNDFSLDITPVTNEILGFGYKCGFLGLLHADVIKERLEMEYNVSIFMSIPSVEYHVTYNDNTEKEITSPTEISDFSKIINIKEPYVSMDIVASQKYFNKIVSFISSKRGVFINSTFSQNESVNIERVIITINLPLSSLIFNFFDDLKSLTSGDASMDYALIGFFDTDVVRVDFMVNHELIEPLAMLIHKDKAQEVALQYCSKLKDLIPRTQFSIPIQASINGKIVAREDVKAFRKDVTQKLYGGDPTRRMKLLEKQKKGKKRTKRFGKVDIPSDVFIKLYT
ncbi:MAG: translation elongation factor 4 [Patescibacteria group bacterium]